MPFWKREKSLAGPGYIILNAIRVINIITLLACICASFSMLVKTFMVSKFFFFDGVSHLITAILSILLLLTEIGLFKRYTATNWPLLSPSSGFVTLGVLMIVIGVTILGNLNKSATSENSLGTPFWRIVIASGILACILGTINVFASYWFRNKALGITARQVRMHGAVANQKVYIPPQGSSCYSTPALSAKPSSAAPPTNNRGGVRSFFPSRRSASLPSYYAQQQQRQPIRNISAPLGSGAANDRTSAVPVIYGNDAKPTIIHMPKPAVEEWEGEKEQEGYAPVINGVQRPDLAHHPALQGGHF